MKKYLILLTLTVLAACAKEAADDLRPADGHYTMTVQASKVETKALELDGSNLNATWAKDEEVSVYNVTKGAALSGTLKAQRSGTSTTLKGELTGTVEANDELTLKFLSPSYGSQNGTLEYIADNCDYAEATVNVKSIDGTDITIKETSASFQNKQAIVKFTLKQKVDNSDLEIPAATALTINDGTNDYTVRPASATNVLFVAIPATGTVILTTTVGGISYSYEKTGAGLLASKYYEITVKMNRVLVNLASITGNITLLDGDIVTGTLGSNRKISIADDATVTLNGVSINGSGTWSTGNYAGLNCLGNATIILADGTTNTVKGFNSDYPGIHVPSGSTLTIQGTGSLNASSKGYGAGIGGGWSIACGNITINGGTITATGGNNSAGIGCGKTSCGNISITGGTVEATGGMNAAGIGGGADSSCGNISITGGTVTAAGGSSGAGIGSGCRQSSSASCGIITISGGSVTATGGGGSAGIGSGSNASCGDITIENTVTSVTATKGDSAQNSIGKGYNGTCGTVTIGGVVGAISTSPYTYIPGALSDKFSVSSTKQVYFSQGNLKYSNGTWSFHTNQYDMCFTSTGSVFSSYNASGTFDLFGFGTSGYDSKYPYMTSNTVADYYGGSINGTEYDWGVHNTISNGGTGWRTLTRDEWYYLLFSRTIPSGNRFKLVTLTNNNNYIPGYIILPDDWENSYYSSWGALNTFTLEQWASIFEAHGAVFLPVSGYREGTMITKGTNNIFQSYYWSSTLQDTYIQAVKFAYSGEPILSTTPAKYGAFVRLVKDVN